MIAVGFGCALFAIITLTGYLVSILMPHTLLGVGIFVAVASAIAWPLAGRLLAAPHTSLWPALKGRLRVRRPR